MHQFRTTTVAAAAAPVLAMVAAFSIAGCTTPGPAASLPTGPLVGDRELSPFYRWAGALPDKPGVMLREEALPASPEITAAAEARRMLYTSTDARWHSGVIPVTGTLYLPRGTPPADGWPIAAWAHGTLGIADVCAPSWAGHKPRDGAYIDRWLQAGFAVVATDYQGLGGPGPHAYLIWESEARSVLDSIRAALASRPGRLANEAIVTGQSQGSGAALGTARIAAGYAPDVRLRAAVATGVVSSFPDGPYKPLATAGGGAPHYTILSMIGGGLRDDAPGVDSLVTDRAKPLLDKARRACSPQVSALARELKIGMADAFTVSPQMLQKYRLPVTDMSMVKIPMPLLLGTGLGDRTIPPQRQYGAVAALCAAGNSVSWKQYPGVSHEGSPHAAFDDALAFARSAIAGQAAAGNCAQASPPGPPGPVTPGLPFND